MGRSTQRSLRVDGVTRGNRPQIKAPAISEREALQMALQIVRDMKIEEQEQRIAEICRHTPGYSVALGARNRLP